MSTTRIESAGMQVMVQLVPHRMALAAMTPEKMQDLLFVSSIGASDPDSPAPKKHGYQRDPMLSRIPQIARYYREDENLYLITPIIVSVRLSDEDEIEEFIALFNQEKADEIHRRWHKAIVSIIDGQHRTLGLIQAWADSKGEFNPAVPVMLYFGLDYFTEAQLFDTINTTQRKLPTALIEMTKGDITEAGEQSHAQRIREIAFSLARDKDSVWFDQINMSGARDADRSITYEGLRRSTSNMLPSDLISRLDACGITPEKWAKSYWRTVSETCSGAWNAQSRLKRNQETGELEEVPVDYRIKDLVGVASIARLGKDILASSLEHNEPNEWMVNLTSKLSEVDWEKRSDNPWMHAQAGFSGQKDLYTILYRLVYLDERPGEAG